MVKLPSFLNQGIVGFLLAGFALMSFAWWQLPDKRWHIYFLDVGQGDAILIKTPENHQILIDGGPKNFVIKQLGEVMPFFDRDIDMIVLTHPDADHLSGLVEVLKRYRVDNVLMTGVNDDSALYDEFLRELREQDIEIFLAEMSQDFKFGGILLDVVYPFEQVSGQNFKNSNNSSVLTRFTDGKNTLLLTGDAELELEEKMTTSLDNLEADILKAGHHGSKTSSSLSFLKRVNPELVVISVGKNSQYGHPHEETMKNIEEAGIKTVRRTDQEGIIEFIY